MKKATIVLFMACVLVADAFSQVTFSGEVHAGVQLQRPYGEGASITATHREYGAPKFDFTATVMRENYGARLDTSFQMTSDPGGHFTLNGIYGWVTFLDNSLRLTLGEISTPAWVTRLDASLPEFRFDEISGFRIEYSTPIQGLSVGAAFRAYGYNLQQVVERVILGANYTHPLFTAVIAYDLGRDANALFGFNFTGLPDLTAGFQLQATNLAIWDDFAFGSPGMLRTYYKVGYRIMRPLNVYLIAGARFFARDGAGMEWMIAPGVTYRFLPNLTGDFRISFDNYEENPNNNLTITTALEYTLRGPAIFYVEYELRLDNMERANHTFGFGITIRAF